MLPAWLCDHADPFRIATFVGLVSAVWVIAGWLKAAKRVKTGDARKLNHATVLAGGVLWFHSGDPLGDRVDCHLAVIVLFALLLMVCRWREWPLLRLAFLGYARETDRPHEAFHVWFSWLVSILGLELVDLVFGSIELTRCAALVLGLADAVGEPIGTRFGKHRYRVRDVLSTMPRQRSWEGSLAVGIVASIVVLLFLSAPSAEHTGLALFSTRATFALLAGLLVSWVEAWTPHGLDNLTIPLTAAILIRVVGLWA
jgi:phytol kinase